MKTGVIVYIAGDFPVEAGIDIGSEVRRLQPLVDRVEVVSRNTGHYDVADAWWALTVKGMQRIFCMVGLTNAAGTFQLKEEALRLCG